LGSCKNSYFGILFKYLWLQYTYDKRLGCLHVERCKRIVTNSTFKKVGVILLALSAGGCAVEQHSTQFSPLVVVEKSKLARLDKVVNIQLDTGYSRTLKPGSLWRDIGSVTQGEVFKPYHDVFTLEGTNVHEAYLVVANNTLKGFYLPVERTFSPLNTQISLTFSQQEQ